MATMVIGLKPRLPSTILDIILLGGFLELLQGFTGRDPEIWDFAANSIGALAGWGAGVWLTGLAGRRALD
jgi:VanZ family protein